MVSVGRKKMVLKAAIQVITSHIIRQNNLAILVLGGGGLVGRKTNKNIPPLAIFETEINCILSDYRHTALCMQPELWNRATIVRIRIEFRRCLQLLIWFFF
jgi:hypothetical protein